jgi:hypothetical protein
MGLGDWIIEKVVVGKLKPIIDKLQGKKTYLILGVALILGALETWNALCGETINAQWCVDFIVPPYVYSILAALGIYTRSIAKK